MPQAPKTLPADFFDKQAAPPKSLPADFDFGEEQAVQVSSEQADADLPPSPAAAETMRSVQSPIAPPGIKPPAVQMETSTLGKLGKVAEMGQSALQHIPTNIPISVPGTIPVSPKTPEVLSEAAISATGKAVEALTPEPAKDVQHRAVAQQFKQRTKELQESPSGFISGVKLGANEYAIPLVGSAAQVLDQSQVYSAAKKLERGEALSDAETNLLRSYAEMVAAESKRNPGIWESVGQSLPQLVTFATEMGLTEGVYTGVKGAATRSITKALPRLAESRAGRLATKGAAATAGAFTQGLTMPSMVAPDAIKRATPQVGVDAQGAPSITAPGNDPTTAIAKAIGSSAIESISERTGAPMGEVVNKITTRLLGDIGKKYGAMQVGKLAEKVGWDGIVEEWLEEQVAKPFRAALENQSIGQEFTPQQMATEALTVGIFGSAMKGLDRVTNPPAAPESAAQAQAAAAMSDTIQTAARAQAADNVASQVAQGVPVAPPEPAPKPAPEPVTDAEIAARSGEFSNPNEAHAALTQQIAERGYQGSEQYVAPGSKSAPKVAEKIISQQVKAETFAKGDTVELSDGRTATVDYAPPAGSQLPRYRVTTADGQKIKNVKPQEIRGIAPNPEADNVAAMQEAETPETTSDELVQPLGLSSRMKNPRMVELSVDDPRLIHENAIGTPDVTSDSGKVSRYAAMPADTAPPIEVVPGRGSAVGRLVITDGWNRWDAAKKRGDKTIRAWVPEELSTQEPASRAGTRTEPVAETVAQPQKNTVAAMDANRDAQITTSEVPKDTEAGMAMSSLEQWGYKGVKVYMPSESNELLPEHQRVLHNGKTQLQFNAQDGSTAVMTAEEVRKGGRAGVLKHLEVAAERADAIDRAKDQAKIQPGLQLDQTAEQFVNSLGMEAPEVELREPGVTQNNGSAYGADSLEAQARLANENRSGQKWVRVDTRDGREYPVAQTVDTVNLQPGKYDILEKRGPNGEVVDSKVGELARTLVARGASKSLQAEAGKLGSRGTEVVAKTLADSENSANVDQGTAREVPRTPARGAEAGNQGPANGGVRGTAAPAREPQVSRPAEKRDAGAVEQPKIGDPVRVMGVDSVLADTQTVDGVRYEIYNGARIKEQRAAVRVVDETGEVVSLRQYPTYDAAEQAYKKAVSVLSRPAEAGKPEAVKPVTAFDSRVFTTTGMNTQLRDEFVRPETRKAQENYLDASKKRIPAQVKYWSKEYQRLYREDVQNAIAKVEGRAEATPAAETAAQPQSPLPALRGKGKAKKASSPSEQLLASTTTLDKATKAVNDYFYSTTKRLEPIGENEWRVTGEKDTPGYVVRLDKGRYHFVKVEPAKPSSSPIPALRAKAEKQAEPPLPEGITREPEPSEAVQNPKVLESWVKEKEKLQKLPYYKRTGEQNSRINELDKLIDAANREVAESKVRRVEVPSSELPDPAKDKWGYRKAYFQKAIEKVLAEYENQLSPGEVRDEFASHKWDRRAMQMFEGMQKPEAYPGEFVKVQIPGDGKFLIVNNPSNLTKLLRGSSQAFSKPTFKGDAKPGKYREAKANDTDYQRYTKGLQDEVDDLQSEFAHNSKESLQEQRADYVKQKAKYVNADNPMSSDGSKIAYLDHMIEVIDKDLASARTRDEIQQAIEVAKENLADAEQLKPSSPIPALRRKKGN